MKYSKEVYFCIDELYKQLLEKCDNIKYYDYIDVFRGKISFEKADEYYKYDYNQRVKKDTYTVDPVSLKRIRYKKF